MPVSMGGNGSGTNPEQLFAAGYAACFGSALGFVARAKRLTTGPVKVTANVAIGPAGAGYGLEVELVIDRPRAAARAGRGPGRSRPRGLPVLERDPRQHRRRPPGRLTRSSPCRRDLALPSRPAVPMSDQLLRLDRQLCFALYAASRAMTRAYGPVLEPLGLTYPQYLVMLVLWETDDRTVGELGDRLGLDSGTLTPLLKRLEQRELIGRSRDPADERVVRIRLTDAGRALRDQATHVPARGRVPGRLRRHRR
jgi:DNA-binding MarR family transcriptional regulator